MRSGLGMVDVFQVQPHHFLADQPPFWSKYAGENLSNLFTVLDKNTINLSFIALLGITYPSDDLILTFNWYLCNLQPYTVVFLVETATHVLNFASTYGLTGQNMVRLDKKSVFNCPPRIHVPF